MEKSSGRRSAKGLTWLRRIVVTLVGLELAWLVLANLFLHTPIGPWTINRRPERWSVAWERAWTPYPGRVIVSGFVYEQHTRTWDIRIAAGDVTGTIRILPLFGRRFRVDGIEAAGVRAAVDRRDAPAPQSKKTKPGWHVELRDVRVAALEELAIEGVPLTGGTATVTGTFETQVRGKMEVRDAHLSWEGARFRIPGEENPGKGLSIAFRGGFSPFNPKVDKGWKSLSFLSGELDLTGRVRSLAPLMAFFSQAKWIAGLDGTGVVESHVVLDEGTMLPGTSLDVEADRLELDFMDFTAGGTGRVTGSVDEAEGSPRTALSLTLDEFHLRRSSEKALLAQGKGLRLAVDAPEIRLGSPLADEVVTLDVPHSGVPDIAVLGIWVPDTLGLRLEKGEASVEGHLEMNGIGEDANGHFRIRGDDLEGGFRDLDFRLDLDASMQLSGRSWNELEVDLTGSKVRLSDGVFGDGGVKVDDGWWMDLEIPSGTAALRSPLTIDADVEFAMRDSRAVIAMVAEVKAWLRHARGILTVRDITGRAHALVRNKHLVVSDLSISGDRLDGEGEAAFSKGDRNGLFWIRYRKLTVAVERADESNDWKLINSREWFETRREERKGGAGR